MPNGGRKKMARQIVVAIAIILILGTSAYAQNSRVVFDRAMQTILSGDYIEFEAFGYGKNKQTASDAAMDGALRNLLGSIKNTQIDAYRKTADAENVRNYITNEVQGQIRGYVVTNKEFSRTDGKWEAKVAVRIPFNKRGLASEVGKVLDQSFKENPPDYFMQNEQELKAQKAIEKARSLERRNIELESEISKLQKMIDRGVSSAADKRKLAELKEEKGNLTNELEDSRSQISSLQDEVERLKKKIAETAENKPEVMTILDKGPYTGLIVDARGLNLDMAMAPKIYAQSDRLVYGYISVIDDRWLNHGMVQYAKSLGKAKRDLVDWVGDDPLVVEANSAKGKNRTDVVVNDTSAVAIFASDVKDHFLEQGRVVFVID